MKTLSPEFLRGTPIPVMPEPRMAKCEPSLVEGAMVAAWRQKGLPLMHVLLFHIPHLLSAAVYLDTLASIEATARGCQDASGRFLTVLHQWTGPGYWRDGRWLSDSTQAGVQRECHHGERGVTIPTHENKTSPDRHPGVAG